MLWKVARENDQEYCSVSNSIGITDHSGWEKNALIIIIQSCVMQHNNHSHV